MKYIDSAPFEGTFSLKSFCNGRKQWHVDAKYSYMNIILQETFHMSALQKHVTYKTSKVPLSILTVSAKPVVLCSWIIFLSSYLWTQRRVCCWIRAEPRIDCLVVTQRSNWTDWQMWAASQPAAGLEMLDARPVLKTQSLIGLKATLISQIIKTGQSPGATARERLSPSYAEL